jgi:hypothetical protein
VNLDDTLEARLRADLEAWHSAVRMRAELAELEERTQVCIKAGTRQWAGSSRCPRACRRRAFRTGAPDSGRNNRGHKPAIGPWPWRRSGLGERVTGLAELARETVLELQQNPADAGIDVTGLQPQAPAVPAADPGEQVSGQPPWPALVGSCLLWWPRGKYVRVVRQVPDLGARKAVRNKSVTTGCRGRPSAPRRSPRPRRH